MSEKMYPIPFRSLMNWILAEREKTGEVFGVHKRWIADPAKTLSIFGEKIESPFGPAAGPNSQLAQNIIAAYVAGARFFEVKTVQKMDGAELAACVPRPCILADDEGYNQEWSTELEVVQALDEYVKAWFALKIMAKVWHYGDPDGFVFNMSVGYDLEGIRGPKIDHYIESMKDASQLPVFAECRKVLTELFPEEAAFIASISPQVSHSITLSTLHGCPPDEIERIASYLLTEKHVHTFVKCNPTILGYHDARTILDSMGYDYIVFDDHHFNEDLQWKDAVPMFERLQALADHEKLQFGLKLSNTFPVDTTRGELPNDEMYMSGRSLFPLTIEMCRRISAQFGGKMKISFAGGADFFNCDKLLAAGIWPVTVATTILKPGGYNRLTQMAEKTAGMPFRPFDGTDTEAIAALSASCRTDPHHCKPVKPLPTRKSEEKVPWFDCYSAPCRGGCPIAQDIPSISSCAARACITRRWPLSRSATPCRSSPARSARTAAWASAPAISMRIPSRSALPSCWRPRRASMPEWHPSSARLPFPASALPSSAAARPALLRPTSSAVQAWPAPSSSAPASSAASSAMSSRRSAFRTKPLTAISPLCRPTARRSA